MDVTSRRISLTAWGRLYGFNKATTSRLHHAGKLPPEFQIEQLPNGRYYVVVPPENDGRLVVYARVSSADQKEDLDRQVGRVVEWVTQQGLRPDDVVKEIGSGLNRFRLEWQPPSFAASGGRPHGEYHRGGAPGAPLPLRIPVCGSCFGWTRGSHSGDGGWRT